jgi:hypothetical protein
VNRAFSEIDDILNVITSVDNNKSIDQLPLFVSTDPDKMPSIKLTDGDLASVMIKLTKIESKLDSHIDNVRKDLHELKNIETQHVKTSKQSREGMQCASNPVTDGTIAPSFNNQLSTDVSHAAAPFYMTSDGTETDDNDGFVTQRVKKRKTRGSPATAGLSATPSSQSYAAMTSRNLPRPTPGKTRKAVLIGASSTCSLRAAKTLIVKKAVFRLGNIDCDYAESDILEYIRSLGVNILSCFELKRSVLYPLDNKSFRICIVAADAQKLCDVNNWSVGVSLREWVHKPKISTAVGGDRVGPSSVRSGVEGRGMETDETITAAAADQYLSAEEASVATVNNNG